jgi:hypothetical protein
MSLQLVYHLGPVKSLSYVLTDSVKVNHQIFLTRCLYDIAFLTRCLYITNVYNAHYSEYGLTFL